MKIVNRSLSLLSALALVVALAIPATASAKTRLAFSGGPDGGTFQYFSNAISSRLSKNVADVEVSNMASAGSVENLRRVNSGDADFGIVYAGDLFLAANGKLTNDAKSYNNVYSLAYLYGAPAHLVVLADGGIDKVMDLAGKRIGVGPAGSGAAASAQRYFTSVGLWDKMKVEFIGYSEAASALGDKKLDAMWVFAGYPNSSIIQDRRHSPSTRDGELCLTHLCLVSFVLLLRSVICITLRCPLTVYVFLDAINVVLLGEVSNVIDRQIVLGSKHNKRCKP